MKQILHSVPPQLDQKQDLTVDFFEPVQWTASIQTRDGQSDAAMLDSCRLIRICGHVGCVLAEKSDGAPHPLKKKCEILRPKNEPFLPFFTILRSERPISTIFPPYIMPNAMMGGTSMAFGNWKIRMGTTLNGGKRGIFYYLMRLIATWGTSCRHDSASPKTGAWLSLI